MVVIAHDVDPIEVCICSILMTLHIWNGTWK
jgi:hypothetical protein